ncbi:hypothetical protein ACN2MM_03235 [Alkalilimnicola ehrlichii MLHE-1]|uniref:Uncharacterized protein n=1 Tax=Alkalilimnicola ehrlichii (strain ATCC BAA-1101 / DSM 17681 / MLHE-1) TaxID=187272 RepID=Q0ABA6_ALKEH|nr:hypothetical protein [Alkalilimnicola ehrlichii]ABI55881.1 hypothetical protein Mlg_0527 [Alkalilimnicola ehrlichii MLHE-1]
MAEMVRDLDRVTLTCERLARMTEAERQAWMQQAMAEQRAVVLREMLRGIRGKLARLLGRRGQVLPVEEQPRPDQYDEHTLRAVNAHGEASNEAHARRVA